MVQSQEDFLTQLRGSIPSVQRVARWLRDKGYGVDIPPLKQSPDISENRRYRDNGDLWVTDKHGRKQRIEVKTTNLGFDNLIIDQVKNHAAKNPPPDFYILLDSRPTPSTSAFWVPVTATKPDWEIQTRYDKKKDNLLEFYFYPRNKLVKTEIPL